MMFVSFLIAASLGQCSGGNCGVGRAYGYAVPSYGYAAPAYGYATTYGYAPTWSCNPQPAYVYGYPPYATPAYSPPGYYPVQSVTWPARHRLTLPSPQS